MYLTGLDFKQQLFEYIKCIRPAQGPLAHGSCWGQGPSALLTAPVPFQRVPEERNILYKTNHNF